MYFDRHKVVDTMLRPSGWIEEVSGRPSAMTPGRLIEDLAGGAVSAELATDLAAVDMDPLLSRVCASAMHMQE